MQVQKLRLQRGWSQQQLAELSGLSIRTIQRIENGQTASTESLKSLASVFEIDFLSLTNENLMTPTNTLPADEQLALSKVRKLKGFYLHLIQYALVITGLGLFNLIKHPQYLWFLWAALGWGMGLLAHAAGIFNMVPFLGAKWERKQVEKLLGRSL